jgi:thiosulfate/3-mercaptopyruvate sulfurtransferase
VTSRAGTVVSTEWLASRLGQPGLRVVDVRGKVLPPGHSPRYLAKCAEYAAAHIPGAVFVDWTRDIVDEQDPIPVQIAPRDMFARTMEALGIGDDTSVVAYDDYDHIFAGRLAWALRYYGHDDVAVLDGGWSRWVAEGRPTTSDVPAQPPPAARVPDGSSSSLAAKFTPRPRAGLRRTAEQVAGALDRDDVLLVDARPPEQYDGRASAAARAGHIPGARNVPYASLIDAASGTFLPPAELAKAFADAGIDVSHLPREVVVYCNGGVSCTVPLQALAMLGRDDVAVYDGSWNEWGNDPKRPIRSGPKP